MLKNNPYGLPGVFFTWDIQYQCNYCCTYCFLNFEKETQSVSTVYLKPQEWIDIWDRIYDKYGSLHIHITGGEPFTYPGFMQIAEKLARRNSIAVSTNLSFDVEEFMRRIDPQNIRIEASFHREFVGIPDFIRKVKMLQENDYLTSVTVVAYPPFLKDIKNTRDIFSEAGLKLILYPYRGPCAGAEYPEGYSDNERKLLEELGLSVGAKVSRNLQEAYSLAPPEPKENSLISPASGGDGDGDDNNVYPGKKAVPEVIIEESEQKVCLMGRMYAKIMPDGKVFRCCNSVWNESKEWDNWGYLGSLVDGTFKLLDEPGKCMYFQYCKCYKSMVVNEESRWRKHWRTVPEERAHGVRESCLAKVKELLISQRYEEAENSACRLLLEYPDDVRLLAVLGEILLEKNDFENAEKKILSAKALNTEAENDSWIARILGKVYCRFAFRALDPFQRGTLADKSRSCFVTAMESAVKEGNMVDAGRAAYELSLLEYFLGEHNKAVDALNKALAHEPENGFYRDSLRKVRQQIDLTAVDIKAALVSAEIRDKLLRFIENMHRDRGFIVFPGCMSEAERSAFDALNALLEKSDFKQVVEEGIKLRDHFPGAPFFSILAAAALIELGVLDEAHNMLMGLRENVFSPSEKYWVERSLGRIYRLRLGLSEDETVKEDCYERSLDLFSRTIRLAFSNNNRADISSTIAETAHLFIERGFYHQADKCLEISVELGFNNDYLESLREKVRTRSK